MFINFEGVLVSDRYEGSGTCSEEGCTAFKFDTDAALREGWDLIEGELFCDLHRPQAARRALAAAEMKRIRERIEELRAERSQSVAKRTLTTAEYAKWAEFQQDLKDFQRAHGKLAPVQLRVLEPVKWRDQYAKAGRIDVELVADSLFEAEERAQRTRDWLMNR